MNGTEIVIADSRREDMFRMLADQRGIQLLGGKRNLIIQAPKSVLDQLDRTFGQDIFMRPVVFDMMSKAVRNEA